MSTRETKEKQEKKCGIIMPISPNSDYSNDHWKDVLNILIEAISETDFKPRLVSEDVAIGLIHERIVNNIYNDDIIICDVSSKNPNVMFELGLRLAFDKPTIIIKDEKTEYSFDTGVIEHINYPSSLRFNKIIEFKKELIKKVNATYIKSQNEKDFSPFLKRFGKTIVPAKIEQTDIAENQYIISKLDQLSDEIIKLRINSKNQLTYNEAFKNDFLKRAYILKYVLEFLDNNPHLDEKSITIDIVEELRENIKNKKGYITENDEIFDIIKYCFKKE